jgi:ribonuclease HII
MVGGPFPKDPTLEIERSLFAEGRRTVAGVDEAGRGPLAGPVVAAAIRLSPEDCARLETLGLRDSKLLSARRREELYETLQVTADIGVSVVGAATIDRIGIAAANHRAMCRAVARLREAPDFVLVDGSGLPDWDVPCRAVVAADRRCLSVAAASIVAKVTRDRIMTELDLLYPGYGFAQHKGYSTGLHLERLRAIGPSPVHRRSFAPMRLTGAGEVGSGDLAA